MKRRTGWILGLLAALLLLGGSAAAEEAPDLTDRCTLKVSAAAKGGEKSVGLPSCQESLEQGMRSRPFLVLTSQTKVQRTSSFSREVPRPMSSSSGSE